MMGQDYAEKRKFARLDIALNVGYQVINTRGKPSREAEAYSSDVSAGGIRLMTPAPLKNGTRLSLDIFLSGDDEMALKAEGEVVWQNEITESSYETGIVIFSMNDRDKKILTGFIEQQMSRLIQTVH